MRRLIPEVSRNYIHLSNNVAGLLCQKRLANLIGLHAGKIVMNFKNLLGTSPETPKQSSPGDTGKCAEMYLRFLPTGLTRISKQH